MAQILWDLDEIISANISILLFKAPQPCPAALLPAFADFVCNKLSNHSKAHSGDPNYDTRALVLGLCSYEKNFVTALTDRMWSVRSGWCTWGDASLSATEICKDLLAGRGWLRLAGQQVAADLCSLTFLTFIVFFFLDAQGNLPLFWKVPQISISTSFFCGICVVYAYALFVYLTFLSLSITSTSFSTKIFVIAVLLFCFYANITH